MGYHLLHLHYIAFLKAEQPSCFEVDYFLHTNIMELTRRPLEVKEDTVSPTTRSAPSPRMEGESLPNDFFKRIVTNSDNLNKKFALSKKDAKLYHKDDENEPWRVYVEDQKWIDIGLGHALFGISQQDQLLYEIDENKNVKRVGSVKRLKEIVEV